MANDLAYVVQAVVSGFFSSVYISYQHKTGSKFCMENERFPGCQEGVHVVNRFANIVQ